MRPSGARGGDGGVELVHLEFAVVEGEGELAVRAAFPDATIIRPSLVFGPEDVLARVEQRGDLFAPVLSLSQSLPA